MAARRPAAVLLWVERDRWRAHRCEAPEEPACEVGWGEADSLCDELRSAGLERTPVIVALESDLSLASRFETANRRQARRRELLAYQIEEPLPVAAEEVVADFHTDGARVLGVAAQRERFERLLDSLRSAGMDLRCVAPGALLASAELARERRDLATTLWLRATGVEQVRHNGAGPKHWRSLPSDPDALRSAFAAQRLNGDDEPAVTLVGEQEAIARFDGRDVDSVVETEGDPCVVYAARMAGRIARGESRPAIDLMRGAPPRTLRNPLRWDQRVLAAALLLVVLTATVWRGAVALAAERRLERITAAETDLFREAFPGKRVPRGVRTRLESELRRIAGTRADLSGAPEHRDAAHRLQEILAQLPTALRYRVTEVRIEGDRVALLGEARSHADADRIAAAVRRSGLTVDPPSTRRLSDEGVEFRLAAQQPDPTPEASR